MTHNHTPIVAIIGAGASGLMAAEILSASGISVQVYEQMPTAGRKLLMAGKTGLNISHSEPLDEFITRYSDVRIGNWVRQFHANDIQAWMSGLGIDSYIGSSGRIFPTQMKASALLRAWLHRLDEQGVCIYYRHRCTDIHDDMATFSIHDKDGQPIGVISRSFDIIILACGGGSYARLGSDGAWQAWFGQDELTPLYASNVGIERTWSPFMHSHFGQALKRVRASVGKHTDYGDIIISHYGMESGVIYKLNRSMKDELDTQGKICLTLDLLPDKSPQFITKVFTQTKKQSLNNLCRKIGLDPIKTALLRECTNKNDWSDFQKMASFIKALPIYFDGFRPIDEAISTGGGVKLSALNHTLQSRHNPHLFVVGEMVDWDAPTGGYLLTACLAMGRAVGHHIATLLNKNTKT
ncbi:TIGR03862 family flavoprotein [Moraxella haemolytica]|uniref:TIGR03862 family flavoprotein n=1 Tax=Moraxella TaxID=475 RepID=UPI0025427861|nr:TIGR03862 family flavoprotein [Moraxella sp. ZY171148]WII96100.1 TIGR03862 family flavoprotein [Moraxella sp. ZY171148]